MRIEILLWVWRGGVPINCVSFLLGFLMVSGTRLSRITGLLFINENKNDYISFVLKNRKGNVTVGLLYKVNNLFLPFAQRESNGTPGSG